MKLPISSSICLFSLTTLAFANYTPGKLYLGVFGGGGSSNHFDGSQFATAFLTEAAGGPLAVNAFGQINDHNASFLGVQLGYQAQEICLSASSEWILAPAVELEGYWMHKSSFDGTLINNTARLPEHDFLVTYPMRRTVFLANAVLNFNSPCLLVDPYIGFGIGSAIVRISDASAIQASPPEEGINHYNANPSGTNSTFAGQIKLGLNYNLNECISFFAEYRWLYLANTHFVFGSTVYPTHAETSSWQVNLDSQKYNLGNVGVRFNW